MDQKCERLYPSAPIENTDLEQRLKKMMSFPLTTRLVTLKKR